MTGFSETFSHYLMEVAPGGGSDRPDDDHQAQNVIFVVGGQLRITLGDQSYNMDAGGYVYIPAACDWNIRNSGSAIAHFHWIRKRYVSMDGVNQPKAFVTSDNEIKPTPMPNSSGLWSTSRFVDPCDLSHDMHVNIVTFQPGGTIPFAETHVMEHGLFILSGKGVYYLNQEWIEVEAGDFLWLRAFCPQACYAGGNSPFRYLLYKDVNRHAPLQILNR